MSTKQVAGRRGFIKQTAAMTAGLAGLGMLSEVAAATPDTGVNILGPKLRYSHQVGTMASDLRRYTQETGLSVKRLLTSPTSEAIYTLCIRMHPTKQYQRFLPGGIDWF
jgi:hypothetical protein